MKGLTNFVLEDEKVPSHFGKFDFQAKSPESHTSVPKKGEL